MLKRILLIEPNQDLGNIIKKYLESNKYKVSHVLSAEKAIIEADNKRPDVVVLELAIADQNGIAFLHEFRSYSDWIKIPIVIHTFLARQNQQIDKSLESLGVSKYLYKPKTSLSDLKIVLKNTLL